MDEVLVTRARCMTGAVCGWCAERVRGGDLHSENILPAYCGCWQDVSPSVLLLRHARVVERRCAQCRRTSHAGCR